MDFMTPLCDNCNEIRGEGSPKDNASIRRRARAPVIIAIGGQAWPLSVAAFVEQDRVSLMLVLESIAHK